MRMLFRECEGKGKGVVALRLLLFLCAVGKADRRNIGVFLVGGFHLN